MSRVTEVSGQLHTDQSETTYILDTKENERQGRGKTQHMPGES